LSFSTAVANGPYPPGFSAHTQAHARATSQLQSRLIATGGATIRGFVFDPNGALIPGAYITIRNTELSGERGTISDGRGEYAFHEVEAGQYNLTIQAQGFSPGEVTNISVRANEESRIDQTLSIAAVQAEVEVTEPVFEVQGAGTVVLPTQPLVRAANADDLDAVSQALVATSDPNVRDQATHLTALECAIRNANREMVQLLLWAKADVNLKDSGGQTVLMMLGDKATSDLVWDLLNAGAKINARDNEGDSALIEAAQVNNLDVLKTLLDAGAKVNISNNEGRTALMAAAGEGLVNNVKALLQAGADLNARDKEGKDALSYAKENEAGAVIRLLKSYGAVDLDPPKEK
jgi:ankyrin repeat protein